jgi:hypothetical protein
MRGWAAIRGYDPVAYLVDGRPAQGLPSLTHDYDGARYVRGGKLYLFQDEQERRRAESAPSLLARAHEKHAKK